MSGDQTFTDAHGSVLLAPSDWEQLAAELELSPRQLQVAQAILMDHKERRIALDLSLSPHTVHTYTRNLYLRLGVNSRAELVRRILTEHFRLSSEGRGSAPHDGERSAPAKLPPDQMNPHR